jgi:hypothetical protein
MDYETMKAYWEALTSEGNGGTVDDWPDEPPAPVDDGEAPY